MLKRTRDVWQDFQKGKLRPMRRKRTAAPTLSRPEIEHILSGASRITGLTSVIMLNILRSEHAGRMSRGEAFVIDCHAMAKAGTLPASHGVIRAARDNLLSKGFIKRIREAFLINRFRHSAALYMLADAVIFEREETIKVIDEDGSTREVAMKMHAGTAISENVASTALQSREMAETKTKPQKRRRRRRLRKANGQFRRRPKRSPSSPAGADRGLSGGDKNHEADTPWGKQSISRATYYRRKARKKVIEQDEIKPRPLTATEQARLFGAKNARHMKDAMRRNRARRRRDTPSQR